MPEMMKCPRCGFEQPKATVCANCKLNIPKYLELIRRQRGEGALPEPPTVEPTDLASPPTMARPSGVSARPVKKVDLPEEGIPGLPAYEPAAEPATRIVLHPTRVEPGLHEFNEFIDVVWEIYSRRFWYFVALISVIYGMAVVPWYALKWAGGLIASRYPHKAAAITGATELPALAIGAFALCVGLGALMHASDNDTLGIRDALRRGFRRVLLFMWTMAATCFVIAGGALALLAPGFLFAMWFGFAPFVFITEDVAGFSALVKSRAYAEGLAFDILTRLLVLSAIGAMMLIIPYLGPYILFPLFLPFAFIYMSQMYRSILDLKGSRIAYESGVRARMRWALLAVPGYLIGGILTLAVLSTDTVIDFKSRAYGLAVRWGMTTVEPAALSANGVWSGATYEGKDGYSFVFDGDKVEARVNGELMFGGTVQYNQFASPRRIDVFVNNMSDERGVGAVIYGTYEISSTGIMSICVNPPRAANYPSGLTPTNVTSCYHLVRTGDVVVDSAPQPIDYKGTVKFKERTYMSGDILKVRYTISAEAVDKAWVSIYTDKGPSPLGGLFTPRQPLHASKGELVFVVPDLPGEYHVRMTADDMSVEVASMPLRVMRKR